MNKTWIGALCLLILSACGMPSEAPEDFSLRYVRRGGLFPQEEELVYNDGRTEYIFHSGLGQNRIELEGAVRDSLWAVLRDNEFDQIKNYGEDTTENGAGNYLAVFYGGENHEVVNWGSAGVGKAHTNNWRQIVAGISRIRDGLLTQHLVDLRVEFSTDSSCAGLKEAEIAGRIIPFDAGGASMRIPRGMYLLEVRQDAGPASKRKWVMEVDARPGLAPVHILCRQDSVYVLKDDEIQP